MSTSTSSSTSVYKPGSTRIEDFFDNDPTSPRRTWGMSAYQIDQPPTPSISEAEKTASITRQKELERKVEQLKELAKKTSKAANEALKEFEKDSDNILWLKAALIQIKTPNDFYDGFIDRILDGHQLIERAKTVQAKIKRDIKGIKEQVENITDRVDAAKLRKQLVTRLEETINKATDEYRWFKESSDDYEAIKEEVTKRAEWVDHSDVGEYLDGLGISSQHLWKQCTDEYDYLTSLCQVTLWELNDQWKERSKSNQKYQAKLKELKAIKNNNGVLPSSWKHTIPPENVVEEKPMLKPKCDWLNIALGIVKNDTLVAQGFSYTHEKVLKYFEDLKTLEIDIEADMTEYPTFRVAYIDCRINFFSQGSKLPEPIHSLTRLHSDFKDLDKESSKITDHQVKLFTLNRIPIETLRKMTQQDIERIDKITMTMGFEVEIEDAGFTVSTTKLIDEDQVLEKKLQDLWVRHNKATQKTRESFDLLAYSLKWEYPWWYTFRAWRAMGGTFIQKNPDELPEDYQDEIPIDYEGELPNDSQV